MATAMKRASTARAVPGPVSFMLSRITTKERPGTSSMMPPMMMLSSLMPVHQVKQLGEKHHGRGAGDEQEEVVDIEQAQ